MININKIKAGSRIKCLERDPFMPNFTLGKEYVVNVVEEYHFEVTGDSHDQWIRFHYVNAVEIYSEGLFSLVD